jgi:hypothetical protein
MSFIILIDFSGCYTQKILTTDDMTSPDNYVIHNKLSAYATNNNTISDGILSGKLDFNTSNLTDSKYLHLYLLSDSSFIIKNDQFTLPVSSIKEIKQRVRDQKKTRTLSTVLIVVASIGVITAVTAVVVGLVQISKTPVPDPDKVCADLEEMELCSDGSPD